MRQFLQTGHDAGRHNGHFFRGDDMRLCQIEQSPDSSGDEEIRDLLSRLRRNSDDAYIYLFLVNEARQSQRVHHTERPDSTAYFCWIAVEDALDMKASSRELFVQRQGPAKITCAYHGHRPGGVRSERLCKRGRQSFHIVTFSGNPAEVDVGQILADC